MEPFWRRGYGCDAASASRLGTSGGYAKLIMELPYIGSRCATLLRHIERIVCWAASALDLAETEYSESVSS